MAQEIIPSDAETLEIERTNKDRQFAGLATWLSAGIVALTGLITAGGAYTGGVTRILRNDPDLLGIAVLCVFAAVVFAMLAIGINHHSRIWKLEGRSIPVLRLALLATSIGSFLGAMLVAMLAATYSAAGNDRPSLSAQLVPNEMGGWSVTGQAGAGGMRYEQRMQVLVYGVLPDTETPQRIFFATIGPDPDGAASESFEAPLPHRKYEAIVVTANHGKLPRDCGSYTAFYAEKDTVNLQPAAEIDIDSDREATCLTLMPPPDFPPQ